MKFIDIVILVLTILSLVIIAKFKVIGRNKCKNCKSKHKCKTVK